MYFCANATSLRNSQLVKIQHRLRGRGSIQYSGPPKQQLPSTSVSVSSPRLEGLGADEVVDYTKEDFAAKYKDQPFDAILDPVGGDTELKSYDLLADNSIYLRIRGAAADEARAEKAKSWVGKTYTLNVSQPSGEDLTVISKLIAEGKVKPHISEVLPLERAIEAEDIASKTSGKVVIQI